MLTVGRIAHVARCFPASTSLIGSVALCALLAAAPLLLVAAPAAAQVADQGSIVTEITVEGAQRVEPTTVRSYMAIRAGQPYSDALVDASLKSLFATGLFADVSIRRRGDELIVTVVENPLINRISFEGNSVIDDEKFGEEVQLRPRQVFTRAKVQADVQRMLELYRRQGHFAANIEPKVVELPQNRVDLIFEIAEGPTTGISRINFIGNEAFSESELREAIITRETRWWRFLTTNDNYDPDRIAADREFLRRFYMTRGYADFRVTSAVAELTPDREDFFVTFTIEEGPIYTFGKADVSATMPDLNPDEMRQLLRVREGELYDAEMIDKSIEALTFYAGGKGYAFVDVRPRVSRNADARTIDVTFELEEGPRVYVDRIDIVGNTRTRDEVIRREMRLVEGDAFNKPLVDRSKTRLTALNYFEKVEITEEPGGAPDRTTLQVEVEEKPTGELSLGLGYSSSEQLVGDISVSERNLLGRGQFLALRLSGSSRRTQVDLRFTEPYFMGRPLVAGFDIYNVESDFDEASYSTSSLGLGLRLGFPVSEFSSVGLRYTLRQDDFSPSGALAVLNPAREVLQSSFGYSYAFSTLDDPQKPTSGTNFVFEQDIAGLGGDVSYVRSELRGVYYEPFELFGEEWVWSVGTNAGAVFAWSDYDLQVTDRFFKGGSTFRGFAVSGIGPRNLPQGENGAVGGEWFAIGTLQLRTPSFLPDEFGITTSLFTDVGTLAGFSTDIPCGPVVCVADDTSLRLSAGISIEWKSPFGPVQFDIGHAFLSEDYDETEVFRFSAGGRF